MIFFVSQHLRVEFWKTNRGYPKNAGVYFLWKQPIEKRPVGILLFLFQNARVQSFLSMQNWGETPPHPFYSQSLASSCPGPKLTSNDEFCSEYLKLHYHRQLVLEIQLDLKPPTNAKIALEPPRNLSLNNEVKLPCFCLTKPLNIQQKWSSWRFKCEFPILGRGWGGF